MDYFLFFIDQYCILNYFNYLFSTTKDFKYFYQRQHCPDLSVCVYILCSILLVSIPIFSKCLNLPNIHFSYYQPNEVIV